VHRVTVKWTVVEARMKLTVVVSNDCHNVTKAYHSPMRCIVLINAVVVLASARFWYATQSTSFAWLRNCLMRTITIRCRRFLSNFVTFS
jgi:hypothetical protein